MGAIRNKIDKLLETDEFYQFNSWEEFKQYTEELAKDAEKPTNKEGTIKLLDEILSVDRLETKKSPKLMSYQYYRSKLAVNV